jgi:hypothetical protein
MGLPSGLFPSGFQTKTPYTLLPSPSELNALPIPLFSILSPEIWWVRIRDHGAPHYVVYMQNGPRKSSPGPYHSVNTEISTVAKAWKDIHHRRSVKWLLPASIHSCARLIMLRYTRCSIVIYSEKRKACYFFMAHSG